MSPHRERVVRGTIVSEHLVHLFDEPASLVDTVATHLHEGWHRGDALLVAMQPRNWVLTSGELELKGCPVTALITSGRLVVYDAATTLAALMVDGEPDRQRFDTNVAAVVRRLCAGWPGLTAYGEMVDILAAEGNFIAAEHLEAFWNDLSTQCSFRLLCGYSSAHFGDARTARHLQRICSQHTGSGATPTDMLASWLLADRRSKLHMGTSHDAPATSRLGETG